MMLICLFSPAVFSVGASAAKLLTFGDYKYVIEDGRIIIISCVSKDKTVEIPSEIDGIPVTQIGFQAFWDTHEVVTFIIPDSVKVIEDRAFSLRLKLKEVVIPDSVETIGNGAFAGCPLLTEITIPKSVKAVGLRVFDNCQKLAAINVDKDNKAYTDIDGVLFNKNATELLAYPEGRADTEYTVPKSVRTVANSAFYQAVNLKKVTLQSGVKSVEASAFSDCKNLSGAVLSDTVTSLGDYVFSGCTALKNISLPNSITSIGIQAFIMSGLTEIQLPMNLKEISDMMFYYCKDLRYVTFGRNAEKFGRWIFTGCTDLTVKGYANTFAEAYAAENGLAFSALCNQLGDINGDGTVDAADAAYILTYYAETSVGRKLNDAEMTAGDVNFDGVIDAADAAIILELYAESQNLQN